MWHEGMIGIKVNGKMQPHQYWVKGFDEGSQYGIDGGRISKLTIKRDGKVVCNYDRGWDVKPQDEATEEALAILMADYN